MAKAIDVVNYICAQKVPSGDLQLQKLVYYTQAWSLAWDGRPLFSERIEAWAMGPVVPAVWKMPRNAGHADALTETEKATIDAVLAHYGRMYGNQLMDLTHREDPWRSVWGERPSNSRCNDEITHNILRRYYAKQALLGLGPKRRPVESDAVDDDEVLAVATANAEIWSETLEILAR